MSELQWLEHLWFVYHGCFELVHETLETFSITGDIITPCHFSPLAEIPDSIELLENSLTSEGVEWRKSIVIIDLG